MPWIHRKDGEITNITNQPNGSEEQVGKDSPEVVAYLTEKMPTNEEIYDRAMGNNRLIKALAMSLNTAGAFSSSNEVLSNADLKTLIKGNM